MATDRKTNFVFYERKVRDEKEIESLLLENDENGDDEENDEWVVQKSAKKLTSTPNQKNEVLNSNRSNRQSSSLKPSRRTIDIGIVSPIKIKRKLSYVVNKVETPPKKRPDIVSPILIKRVPDSDSVAVIHSPSACRRKPTIELTSSDDEEDAKKSKLKRKNKKRRKSSDKSSFESEDETRVTRTSPKKRITYFEGNEDDDFELHTAKPSRQMPPRKSKPSRLKLDESEDEEQIIKKTPSRRCKLQQNRVNENDDEPSIYELGLPLSSKERFRMPWNQTLVTEGSSDDGLFLPLSGKKRVEAKGEATQTMTVTGTPLKTLSNGTPSKALTNGTPSETGCSSARVSSRKRSGLSDIGISRVLNALEAVESLNLSPSKCSVVHSERDSRENNTPSKSLVEDSPAKSSLTNGTLSKTGDLQEKQTGGSARASSRKRSLTRLVDESRLSGMSRVLHALEAVESMNLSPSKCSVVQSKVDTPKSRGGSSSNTPSKSLVEDSPTKSSSSRRKSRRNLEEVFVEPKKSDVESDSSSTEIENSSNEPKSQPTRGQNVTKTPSKNCSSGEVGTPVGKGSPFKTPAKKEALQSGDALSKADVTPEKGCTPGKPVAKSTRSTPAKGTTPSKSTPAKPSSVVIPVSSSEDDELATPLRRGYKRAAKSKPPPKVETPLKRTASTPLKTTTPLRRSARVSMSPSTPSLRQKVLLANTPRSSLLPVKDESESEEEFVTPRKAPKSAKKKLDMTPSTPTSCRKVGHGFLSPVVAEREKRGPSTPSSDLGIARAQLQVSTLPKSLPCREKEFGDIKNFIIRKLKDGTGGCMYISGVPGTGKTATVHTVVRALQKMAEDRELSAFDFVEVNGLRLTEPRQAYVRVWQGLTKNKVTPDQSLKHLETKFSGKPKRSTVLLVDELDYLCNRRQDVIYNILDWTTKRYSKLVVLTIANTMDLPERTLKGKVTSRMGLTRLVFQPYNFHQLEEIVLNRLDGCKAFNPDAVQLVARKVAAVSGDARRALDICRRSTEILELEGRTNVSVLDIQKVLTQIFAGSRVQAIKNCSVMAKLVLRAIKDEVLRTGVEETTIAFIHPQLVSICALEGKREPTITDLLAICTNLAESGLLFAEKGRKDINRKISLNVSTDDIHYAINC